MKPTVTNCSGCITEFYFGNDHMEKSIFAAMIILISLILHPAVRAYQSITSSTLQQIKREMSERTFDESGAEDFYEKYGPASVPLLINMMSHETSPQVKGKIAFYLGK